MGRPVVVLDLRGTLTKPSSSYGLLGPFEYYEDAAHDLLQVAHACLKTARALKRQVTPRQLIPSSFKRAVWGNISRLDPQAIEAIVELRRLSIATALLSNDPQALGERALRYGGIDIDGMFDRVRFAERKAEKKPNPDGLNGIVSSLSDVSTAFMVGDRASDMLAVFNAARLTTTKIVPVAVRPDTEAAKFLRELGRPDTHILDGGMSQLPSVVSGYVHE